MAAAGRRTGSTARRSFFAWEGLESHGCSHHHHTIIITIITSSSTTATTTTILSSAAAVGARQKSWGARQFWVLGSWFLLGLGGWDYEETTDERTKHM
ncbi:uncharacterized protein K452DRAFT_168112 [Aplosporella prunicola CBS 121167]|uniref:Uncharacterized protein n=1 Tax=Aplosporella prunicola CBS 121167 TaxID=1176127 RepID=A0A6A6BK87_9PEZI|nr:uncharacterized protein K452DRAFT_168112 [Aplosporella prunicola CBS 121167]KAF2143257.1 hypothetical protein K452DRAFT_168112 [Aplosporella prunicola CBS 121167]